MLVNELLDEPASFALQMVDDVSVVEIVNVTDTTLGAIVRLRAVGVASPASGLFSYPVCLFESQTTGQNSSSLASAVSASVFDCPFASQLFPNGDLIFVTLSRNSDPSVQSLMFRGAGSSSVLQDSFQFAPLRLSFTSWTVAAQQSLRLLSLSFVPAPNGTCFLRLWTRWYCLG